MSYSLGGGEPQVVSLRPAAQAADGAAPTKREALSHMIDLEALGAEPDQLVSYHFWADDAVGEGQSRRTMSDMFFAEVRRFDEIFRQGQQPTGQQMQGGGGQQTEQLAELQKQIAGATWKLVRRETADQPTPGFADDARTVQKSQEHAIDLLKELAGELTDAQAVSSAQDSQRHMETAVERLTTAAEEVTVAPLQSALSAEQRAYQSLLELHAPANRRGARSARQWRRLGQRRSAGTSTA